MIKIEHGDVVNRIFRRNGGTFACISASEFPFVVHSALIISVNRVKPCSNDCSLRSRPDGSVVGVFFLSNESNFSISD